MAKQKRSDAERITEMETWWRKRAAQRYSIGDMEGAKVARDIADAMRGFKSSESASSKPTARRETAPHSPE